ncbi:hypothetical protein [Streptomyces lateritius]|uniref:hypothetical protein n=1 Tax=Streptomyces lateritius TaxID=67313 RepID=UPI001672F136|nr:hypothetical protein [Streptomyces lateritius]GGU12719.1 hypothetical protein GCM10010272_67390 [Streptomyces lateritius]
MRRRLAAFLLSLVSLLGLAVAAPQPAAADGPINDMCQANAGAAIGAIMGPAAGLIAGLGSDELCDTVGEAVRNEVKEEWDAVWDSVLGDAIVSSEDVVKWMVKKVLTVALVGPSVDLEATGLWGGQKATLAGMLTWLGLLIAAAGMMWQFGKMAVTGQVKHAGRAMAGWVENIVLSTIGVGMFALLLTVGDVLSAGLVEKVFNTEDRAYDRVIKVMMPEGIANPILVGGVCGVLLLIGFVQLITVFLRQSAIPIICLLLPVAGAGRAGGDATRQWAPKLITSGLVIVAYKPLLAIIICTGFAEFGEAVTLAEWLRGCATLLLGILAPGPLMKIFAPFGAAVGGGMAAGGMSPALAAAADYFGGKSSGSGGGGGEPASAVDHAQYVQKSMGSQGGGGEDGEAGSDAQAQAARNESARIPAQAGAEAEAVGAGVGETATGTSNATGVATTTAGPAGAMAAAGIQVLDGVNDTIQGASGAVGGGNEQ